MGIGDVDQQCCCIQVGFFGAPRKSWALTSYPLSMWPLLKRDGLGIQYVALTVLWNAALGYTPFKRPKTFIQSISLVSDFPASSQTLLLNTLPRCIGCLGCVCRPSRLGTHHPTTSSVPGPFCCLEHSGQHPGFRISLAMVNQIWDRSRLGGRRSRWQQPVGCLL